MSFTNPAFALIGSILHAKREPSEPQPTAEELKPEYDLIMLKKSKLSRSKRDAVVRAYERLTNKITTPLTTTE